LNYCATHPNATVRFHASDMILHVESDASYLSEPKARSRAAGYHYLSNKPPTTPDQNYIPTPNGAIHVGVQILKEVCSSAAETELAALFHNGKDACPIRTALEEMRHPQPPTPMVTDNSTAKGIATDSVKQKQSKAMDMRFYWIRDRVRQGQFHVYWNPGKRNKADYFTKHHPAKHHQAIRSAYLHDPTATTNYFECLQCIDDDDDDDDDTSGEGVLIPQPNPCIPMHSNNPNPSGVQGVQPNAHIQTGISGNTAVGVTFHRRQASPVSLLNSQASLAGICHSNIQVH